MRYKANGLQKPFGNTQSSELGFPIRAPAGLAKDLQPVPESIPVPVCSQSRIHWPWVYLTQGTTPLRGFVHALRAGDARLGAGCLGGAGDAAAAPMLQGCAEGRVLGKEEPAAALVGLQDGEGLQRGAAGRDGDAGRCTGRQS